MKPAALVAVFVSSLMMGVTHPWAKRFLFDSSHLLPFTLMYVAARVLTQLPFTFYLGGIRFPKRSQILWLLGFGVAGGLLRILELVGISKGVPVAMVTFLVYSHPIWTILLARLFYGTSPNRTDLLKLAMAVTGVVFIAGLTPADLGSGSGGVVAPICAGFLVAVWVVLSRELQKRGCAIPTISFYYDVISLLVVAAIALPDLLSGSVQDSAAWSWVSERWFELAVFAFISGVLPNFLFYFGAQSLPPTVPALLLLFDPVFSALLAAVFWSDKITSFFLFGAGLIILTNLPDAILVKLRNSLRVVSLRDLGQLLRGRRARRQQRIPRPTSHAQPA